MRGFMGDGFSFQYLLCVLVKHFESLMTSKSVMCVKTGPNFKGRVSLGILNVSFTRLWGTARETVEATEWRSADRWDWRKTSDAVSGTMDMAAAWDRDKPWWAVCVHSGIWKEQTWGLQHGDVWGWAQGWGLGFSLLPYWCLEKQPPW